MKLKKISEFSFHLRHVHWIFDDWFHFFNHWIFQRKENWKENFGLTRWSSRYRYYRYLTVCFHFLHFILWLKWSVKIKNMRISNIVEDETEISDHPFLLLDSGLLTPIGLLFQLQSDCTFTFVLKYSFVFFNYLPSSLFSSYKMNNPLLVDIEFFTEYTPVLIHTYI